MFVADVCMKINRWKLEALGCNTKQESNEHSHVLDHSHQFFLDTTAAFSKSGTDVAPREEKIQSKVESYKNDCNPQEPPNEIHMLVRFRVLLPSAGSSPITPYFPARSADQNLEFLSLAWILGKQMPGQTVQFTQGQDSLGEKI